MGPVFNGELDQAAFLQAIDVLATNERVAMTELECRHFQADAMRAAGYTPVDSRTFLVRLTPADDESMWKRLSSTCRNRIRKAQKAGLWVEDTQEVTMTDEFYDQFTAVMNRKGLVPPYPRLYPRLLFQWLKKVDRLFALRVKSADGRLLATGLFPHDNRTVYFWGGGSWQSGRELCPNEFLHWRLMQLAAERGLQWYDTCGPGQFKKKFGGTLVSRQRWHKCHWKSARWARWAYEQYFLQRMRWGGRLASLEKEE